MKAICKYTIILFMAALIVLGMAAGTARANEPLVITGTGLKQDLVFDEPYYQFFHPQMEELYYSSNNNLNFKSIWRVKGFPLRALLDQFGEGNLKEGAWPITFIAKDSLSITMMLEELENRYYYPDLTLGSERQVGPMIGIYRARLFNAIDPPAPISWVDRNLTGADRDPEAPRLYFGQVRGNINDKNQPFFIRELVRIVVGEERPSKPPEQPNPPGPPDPPGPGDELPAGPQPQDPGPGSTLPPESGPPESPGDPAKPDVIVEPGKPSGSNTDYISIPQGWEKAQELDTAGEQSPRSSSSWPWIVVAAVGIAGVSGGGYYFVRKRLNNAPKT